MRTTNVSISIPGQSFSVSAILDVPKNAGALLVLAHGAGAGMRHSAMSALADALNLRKIATLRFQFIYMEKGSKRPDSPSVAMAVVESAVRRASELEPHLPLYAGGKSFGGRMTTNAAAIDKIPQVRGIICFGFPLHPPKKPGTERAEHLAKVRQPVLFIQGTRDDLADLTLMKKVVVRSPRRFRLHIVAGANHSFSVLKSSGRTDTQALAEVADTCGAFCLK
jgi:uncharacterized protein